MDSDANSKAGTTGTVNQKKSEIEVPNLTGRVHLLPCCIKYDGPSAVAHYFKAKPTGVEVEGMKVEEAYFRGRKLQGATVPIPNGYSGFVIGKKSLDKRKASDMSEQNSDGWKINAKFENVTYWNHDSLPSKDDAFVRSLHWFSVAEALHKPVTAEDLASASIALEKRYEGGPDCLVEWRIGGGDGDGECGGEEEEGEVEDGGKGGRNPHYESRRI
ncbi:unnamed protein product [Dovyalis caffra]|uniref:Uncharacterized protein n=1 Tax=Dovyalis caffra TaxID=77055 RepID=A0AAV1RNK5_9ROSI|nr:unnamed protein product [Dovyalis caffra]